MQFTPHFETGQFRNFLSPTVLDLSPIQFTPPTPIKQHTQSCLVRVGGVN